MPLVLTYSTTRPGKSAVIATVRLAVSTWVRAKHVLIQCYLEWSSEASVQCELNVVGP